MVPNMLRQFGVCGPPSAEPTARGGSFVLEERLGATIAQGSIAETRQLAHGHIDFHRLRCIEAYGRFDLKSGNQPCPGHAIVEVLCKSGSVSMKDTDGYSKCSVCKRYLQTKFRYKLVAAVPPDVPRLPNPYAGKSGTEIQILVNRGE